MRCEPNNTDSDQIDRDDIIKQTRRDKNKHARQERHYRLKKDGLQVHLDLRSRPRPMPYLQTRYGPGGSGAVHPKTVFVQDRKLRRDQSAWVSASVVAAAIARRAKAGIDLQPVFFMIEAR